MTKPPSEPAEAGRRAGAMVGVSDLQYLRQRIVAIRDEVEKPRPRSDFNLAYQLSRLIDDLDNAIGGHEGYSTNLAALVPPVPPQVIHGMNCPKAPHGVGGYLHLSEDDGPYRYWRHYFRSAK